MFETSKVKWPITNTVIYDQSDTDNTTEFETSNQLYEILGQKE